MSQPRVRIGCSRNSIIYRAWGETIKIHKKGEKNVKTFEKKVYEANMQLPQYGLVTFTWGNVSGIDRDRGLLSINRPVSITTN